MSFNLNVSGFHVYHYLKNVLLIMEKKKKKIQKPYFFIHMQCFNIFFFFLMKKYYLNSITKRYIIKYKRDSNFEQYICCYLSEI
jgi:uncharacterized membrane protein